MPVWNSEYSVEAAVCSVIEQDFNDWELIIVDDGSTDSSGKICDALAAQDSRIVVLHQENSGVSEARNAGIDAASGEFLAFLDSDDLFTPKMLSTLVSLADSTGCDSAACGNMLSYPDGHEVCESPPLPAGNYSTQQARLGVAIPLLSDRLCRAPVNGYIWRYIFRSDIVRRCGLRFSGAYLEDELFLIEFFAAGASLCVTDEALYVYSQNPRSVTRSYLPDFNETFFNSLRLKKQLVEKYSVDVPNHWLDNTCWAGLLIAVANEFAPGNDASLRQKAKKIRSICEIEEYAHAVKCYAPSNMPRNKSIVAALLRHRMYGALSLLYFIKNSNRG